VSSLLGRSRLLVIGIALPTDSFVLRVHPFEGGRPLIDFIGYQVFP